MNTCRRCEKELPEGQTECEDGCGRPDESSIKNYVQNYFAKCRVVDWSTVKTADDLIAILSVVFEGVRIDPVRAARIERFLLPKQKPTPGT